MADHRCFECVFCGGNSAAVIEALRSGRFRVQCPDCGEEWIESAVGLEAIEVFE